MRTMFAVVMISLGGSALAASRETPRLIQTIPLGAVRGRLDHMALDGAGDRLFLAALGNNTVEVIDLRAARHVRTLRGFDEPQGVGFAASPPRLFVASGAEGTCSVLDGGTYHVLRTVRPGDDPDNVRVDREGRRVYVGYGAGGLAILDPATGDSLGHIPLPAHPESFQLAADESRIFVNVPDAGEVCVVEVASCTVVDHWPLDGARANFAMALDPAGRRVFVACRKPAEVLALDASSGAILTRVAIDRDADDLAFDARRQRLYVSCGGGFVDIVAADAGAPRLLERVATSPGARTSLFDEAHQKLYLAVPSRGARPAELRVFDVAAK